MKKIIFMSKIVEMVAYKLCPHSFLTFMDCMSSKTSLLLLTAIYVCQCMKVSIYLEVLSGLVVSKFGI